MLRLFILFLCFFVPVSSFAGGWAIEDVNDRFKILRYNGSKAVELNYSGSWYISCLKGRKRGNSGRPYDTLKTATQFAISVCNKS
ncbi:hypothetical protein N9C35_02175 [Flavobacteriaceae bacterium]|nr:hypothetical protein [Flavobacteriaceae bacterium]